MSKITLRLLSMTLLLAIGAISAWAEDHDFTVRPSLEKHIRFSGNATDGYSFVKGYPKDYTTVTGTYEMKYTAGLVVLQQYDFSDVDWSKVTKLTIQTTTSTDKNGYAAYWIYDGDAAEAITADVFGPKAVEAIGIDPGNTTGPANADAVTNYVSRTKVDDSHFTEIAEITGEKLATLKTKLHSGKLSLIVTRQGATSNNQKWMYSSNEANGDYRPVIYLDYGAIVNASKGTAYASLNDAFGDLQTGENVLELNNNVTLDGRRGPSAGQTVTLKPMKDGIVLTRGNLKGNSIWFLTNAKGGDELNIGSDEHQLIIDGENKTDITNVVLGCEAKNMNVTNVKFVNFNIDGTLNKTGGNLTLKNVVVENSSTKDAFFTCSSNDKLILDGSLNFVNCTGTDINLTARMKVINGATFTASQPITLGLPSDWSAGTIVIKCDKAADPALFVDAAGKFVIAKSTVSGHQYELVLATPAKPTAKIGDTEYADLVEALAAVENGGEATITLLADQEIGARINIANRNVTIDGNGFSIKRATNYNKILMLTVKPATGEKAAHLTLQNVTIDGQNVATTTSVIEAGNAGYVTLKNVTLKNCKTTSSLIVNKANGHLTLDGVKLDNSAADDNNIFVGTSNTALVGDNPVGTIYIEGDNAIDGTQATHSEPLTLRLQNNDTAKRGFGLIVFGSKAGQYTVENVPDGIRISNEVDGLYALLPIVENAYTHPALMYSADEIAAAKARLAQDPYKASLTELQRVKAGNASGAVEWLKRMDAKNWSGVYSDYSNYTAAVNDAHLAYELALNYTLTGNTSDATTAVAILNQWAKTNKGFFRLPGYGGFLPDPNENLILIQGYQFANAAELLSDYTDWKAADKESFKTWIHHTFGDNALIYLSGRQDQHYWLNWDLAALSSLMSVGVLCNDKAMVDYALNYIDNGAGTGSVNHAIVALHNDGTLAQCQEVGRDQGHATLDVTLMGALCQTAKNANVGVDLFEKYHALEMAEYIGMYNLKDANGSFVNNDVPFTAYTVDDNEYTAISDASRGTERNCWELFHAYAKANNKTAKNVEAWVKYLRDKNAYGEGASTSNDELGFGTLMYGAATTATGIKGVTTDKIGVSSPAIYNLAGQRVGKDYKGLVIINGKKVVKK